MGGFASPFGRLGRISSSLNEDVLDLTDEHRAVAIARRFVAERLTAWGRPEAVDDAELCTSELVTNAILHAHCAARLLVRADQDAVRIEVHDSSRNLPARGRVGDDAMTGRGLLLIEALATSWGVDPGTDGKSVWFELSTSSAGPAGEPTAEELLSAWEIDESVWEELEAAGPPRFLVALDDVPTSLLLDAIAHVENLVREFTLAAAWAESGSSTAPPEPLAELIHTVVGRFSETQLAIRAQAQQAAEAGADRVRLELDLPVDAATAGEEYLGALDDADDYCRAARLLTLESPPQFRVFRQWYVEQLARQLRDADAGRPASPAQPFEARLLEELGATAAAQAVAERNARLQRLTAAFAGALTPQRVAQAVLDEGVRALGASAACLLVPGRGELVSVLGSVGYDETMLHRLTRGQSAELPSVLALRSGEPVWVESREERDARFPTLAGLDEGTVSMCVLPLSVEGGVLGVLRFSFNESRLFGADERDFIGALAAQTAQALDRARLYVEERAARQSAEAAAARLRRLHSVGSRWSTTATVGAPAGGAMAERRVAGVRVAPPVEWASLAYQSVLDELSDAIVVADAGGTIRYVNSATERLLRARPGELTGLRLCDIVPRRLRAAHLAGVARYLATGEPKVIGTAVRLPALRRDGTEVEVELSLGTAPLAPGPGGGEGDLLLIGSLRDIGDRIELEQQLMVGQYLRATMAVTSRLAEVSDPDDGLANMLPTLCADLDWDVAASWRLAPATGELTCVDVWPDGDALVARLEGLTPGAVLPMDADLPGTAVTRGVPVLVADVATAEFPRAAAAAAAGLRTALAVPLMGADGPVGVIEFFARQPREVDSELLGVLASIGRQLGQFLDRVAAEADLRRVAHALQASLSPPELPDVPGVRLAARYRAGGKGVQVGGDFYDVFPAGDGSWGVVIGDVCGKGVEAATVTALARHTLRAAARHQPEPQAALLTLNAALTGGDERPFVTACYFRLLPVPGQITGALACAGHPLPLLLDAGGGVVPLGTPGSLLGVVDDPELTCVPVVLAPGSSLVFYTDGITESQSDTGHRLGESGLAAALRQCVGRSPDEIADAVVGLAAAGSHADDLAVLVLAVPQAP